jgi:transcriptional regulator with XRE-family HTH domain
MTRPRKNRAAHEARGERAKIIRDALGLSQTEFLPLLNQKARQLGLPAVYTKDYVVSRTETGARPMTFEDVAVWLALDPEERPWDWLVFGPPSVGKIKQRPGFTVSDAARRRSG